MLKFVSVLMLSAMPAWATSYQSVVPAESLASYMDKLEAAGFETVAVVPAMTRTTVFCQPCLFFPTGTICATPGEVAECPATSPFRVEIAETTHVLVVHREH